MNIIIPQNIYSTLFALTLKDNQKENIVVKESSLILKELEKDKDSIAIIPTLDLLRNPDLFVSQKFAISFDGILSNSYFYFKPDENKLDKILLRGDISSNDLILSKILFPEQYGIEPEFAIDTKPINYDENNYLIVGMENESNIITRNGISFSDHIADLIHYPYVNFVAASHKKEIMAEFNKTLGNVNELINANIGQYLEKLNLDSNVAKLIGNNINTVYFDFTENEREALEELLKLPYYNGMVEDFIEVNYI